jgi:hypothetical protein
MPLYNPPGGGSHPDLATHDTLGLATDAELTTHAGAADPHTGYVLESDHTSAAHDTLGLTTDALLSTAISDHAGAADPHTGYLKEADFDDVDFLVGTATGLTAAEIVVGTTPGGELGGTWASPTVDATHSGSTHGAATTTHEAAADPHPGYVLESLLDAKGDLIAASADNTPAKVTVGANNTLLQADSTAGAGLKWTAPGFGVTSALAVSLTTASAYATAETTISAATYADITGATVSLAAGTWLLLATVNGSSQTTTVTAMFAAITHSDNTVISESSQHIVAGTATVRTWGNINLVAIVSPGSTTSYKLRGARGTTTQTGNWIASDGNGVNTANNVSNNTDKGTGIFAVRIA